MKAEIFFNIVFIAYLIKIIIIGGNLQFFFKNNNK